MADPSFSRTAPASPARAKFLRSASARALELSRRTRHVEGLLRNWGLDDGEASAWVLAFVDEQDPLMVLPEWLRAGWRDPRVVQDCLRICGSREASEALIDFLEWETSKPWDSTVPGALLEAAQRT